MLELVIKRLKRAGVDAVVINAFHLSDQIEVFLKSRKNLGLRVQISKEDNLLDTGGGLKKASSFFDDGKPFYVHNVDVISDVDLGRMYRFHVENKALATLAVRDRESERFLLFDAKGRLCGRGNAEGREWAGPEVSDSERLAFDGIHVVSPEIFPKMTETGVFPIMQAYLHLAGVGEKILAFKTDGSYWRDIGGMDKLKAARAEAARSKKHK
jgi:NDP-sugar pyrophosphorylase family protein